MPRFKLHFALPLALAAIAGAAQAYDPIVVSQKWRQVAFDSDGACAAEVRTNGKFALVNAAGLGAGTQARYYLTNAEMKPIDWAITANGKGEWQRYYSPFLPGHDAGTVAITLSTRQCTLELSFAWDTYNPANDWTSIRAMGGESIAPRDDRL